MKFSEYFNNWLYAKDGYYSEYKTIGKEGDFFTAVSTSKFFGGTIGKRVVDVIESGFLPKDTCIIEVGAHHGYLLADMIEFIHTLKPELLKTLKFAIVERFPHLQKQQIEYFKDSFGDVIDLIHYDDISQIDQDNAFVVANEIFDAFECELIYTKDGVRKIGVVNDHKIEFIKCEDEEINSICDKYKIEKGEIALGYEGFAEILCDRIGKFEFVTFDYGDRYPRNDFSARVYSKHEVYPIFEEGLDLKSLYKNSDITYDVHFNHLMDCFKSAGVDEAEFTTQLKALVEFGIIELLEMVKDHASENDYLREAGKIKTLLEPTGMGDRFKMARFRKNG